MIKEIDKNELDSLINSFINVSNLKEEFNNNPFAKIIILEEDQKVIGYIYYSDIYERVEINQFEIEKSNRNCGKGSFLLKEFIKLVDKYITLEVREDNYSAIRVYEKNNFNKKAIRKGYYNGIDGILMERKL